MKDEPAPTRCDALVAIGASAGGPQALAAVLARLPRDFPAAVVAVVHVDELFAADLADWLGLQSALPVRLARAGDVPSAATVLVAGAHGHLVLRAGGVLDYAEEPADSSYRPSIDVFLHSVCRHWRGRAVGVQLSGIGSDGALGLKAMHARGWPTLAQDRASSAVFGMPAAAAREAGSELVPLDQIAARLRRAVQAS